LLNQITAEITILPLNHGVAFVKERDIVLTNGNWHLAIDLDTTTYLEVVAIVREDLLQVERQRREFTADADLKQIENLVGTLERKINDIQQLFPRMDSRRGLFNVGGVLLKSLFGVATNVDTHKLHESLNGLKDDYNDVIHSMSKQLTYIRKFDTLTELNAVSIANLSSVVKDFAKQSHDNFQQVTRDILWLNATLQGQNELHTAVRQLELALLTLTQRFDELTNAVQYMSLGKLPMGFINPTTLHNILRNISLRLPENFELVAGVKVENIHLYYELKIVTVLVNTHGIKVLMSIPLKTADSFPTCETF